LTVISNRKAPL